ncbi:MAG: GAP family protein [Trebonia sp.]
MVGAIVLSVAGPAGANSSGSPATWVSWVKVVPGLLLLLVAARQFRGRPKDGEQAHLPKWMARIDDIRPLAACGLAALLAGVNPKNLLLAVGGAASIAQTGISGGQQAIAYLVFALVATLGVGTPVAIYVALGPRAEKPLAGLKDWMGQHNAAIMSVLCLVIGDRRRHQRADYLTTKVKINIHPERLVLTFPAHRASGPRAARRPASGCRSARRFTRRG